MAPPKKRPIKVRTAKPAVRPSPCARSAAPTASPEIQAATLRGLGLGKIHRMRTLEDTPPCAE